jgi:hypothetical protein
MPGLDIHARATPVDVCLFAEWKSIHLWTGIYSIAFSASAMFKRIFAPTVSSVAPHVRSFSRPRLTAAQVKRQLEVVKDKINVRCASICLFFSLLFFIFIN